MLRIVFFLNLLHVHDLHQSPWRVQHENIALANTVNPQFQLLDGEFGNPKKKENRKNTVYHHKQP